MEEFSAYQKRSLATMLTALKQLHTSLSLPQLVALISVALEPGLSVNELAERMDVPQQTASRHVSTLMGRYETPTTTFSQLPLLAQTVNQKDPRSRSLLLTPAGRTLVSKLLISKTA